MDEITAMSRDERRYEKYEEYMDALKKYLRMPNEATVALAAEKAKAVDSVLGDGALTCQTHLAQGIEVWLRELAAGDPPAWDKLMEKVRGRTDKSEFDYLHIVLC